MSKPVDEIDNCLANKKETIQTKYNEEFLFLLSDDEIDDEHLGNYLTNNIEELSSDQVSCLTIFIINARNQRRKLHKLISGLEIVKPIPNKLENFNSIGKVKT